METVALNDAQSLVPAASGFLLADVLGVMAVFKAANALRKRRHRLAAYGVRLTSLQGGHVVGSGGVGLATRLPPPQLAGPSNSLVLSGMPDGVRVGDGSTSMQRLRAWLSNGRRRLRRCALLGSKTLLPLMPRIRLDDPHVYAPDDTGCRRAGSRSLHDPCGRARLAELRCEPGRGSGPVVDRAGLRQAVRGHRRVATARTAQPPLRQEALPPHAAGMPFSPHASSRCTHGSRRT